MRTLNTIATVFGSAVPQMSHRPVAMTAMVRRPISVARSRIRHRWRPGLLQRLLCEGHARSSSAVLQAFLVGVATAGLCLLGMVNPCLATTIDFEGFADSTSLTTQIAGLTFTNATIISAGNTLNAFEFPPHSGINVVFDDGGAMTIDFATAQPSVSGFFTYSVPLTIQAFDGFNIAVGIVNSAFSNNEALSGNPGSSPNEFLSVTASDIARVMISGDLGGSSFALDDLTVASVAVSEPSTLMIVCWAIAMLLGAKCLMQWSGRALSDEKFRRS